MPFCMRDRVQINGVHRGPFKSSREWLRAQLDIIQLECENYLEKITLIQSSKLEENDVCERVFQTSISVVQSDHVVKHSHVTDWKNADEGPSGNNEVENAEDDEDDSEEQDEDSLQARSELIKRLIRLLPRAIPQTNDRSVERSVLSHPDLSLRNILVDEESTITAILDWENSACLPTWAECDVPSLLEGQSLHSLPNPEDYNRGEQESLFKERSNWYQLTGLRETFLSYMKEKCPSWTEIYENSRVQRDFRRAVELCDYDLARSPIDHWLTIFEKNNFSVDRNQYIPLDL